MTAPEPYFQTRQDLFTALRLTGAVADGKSSVGVIDAAIRAGKSEFIRRLGGARVSQIVALRPSDNPEPQDRDANLRQIATTTEQMVVREHLIDTLPQAYLDGSADVLQRWNDDGGLRTQNSFSRQTDREKLQAVIEQNFAFLEGTEGEGDEATVQGASPGAKCGPHYLGESVL